MHARFYVPDITDNGLAALPSEEAEHLARVMRLKVGDTVLAFDGRGNEFVARVHSIARREVVVAATSRAQAAPEPQVPITLALGVTKGERIDDAVRDAVMLGASRIQPVLTEHSETMRKPEAGAGRVERWRRIAISSAKQCRRSVVPEIGVPLALTAYLGEEESECRLLLVEPNAVAGGVRRMSEVVSSPPRSAAILVGPEGGWSHEEIEAARSSGFVPTTLGKLTLRSDAVPLVALAVLRFVWGDI